MTTNNPIKIKVEIKLIAEEKEFHIKSDIAFDYGYDHIICKIDNIVPPDDNHQGYIIGSNIEQNGIKIKKTKLFYFDLIKNVNYVYYD